MRENSAICAITGLAMALAGCAESEPQPVAQRVAVPPPGAAESEGPVAGAPSLPQPGPNPSEPETDGQSPSTAFGASRKDLFLAAHREVTVASIELLKTLDGVTDAASAEAAAPRIAELTGQWKSAAERATA